MVKNLPASAGDIRDIDRFDPWVRKMPWKRAWQPTAVFLPGESQGQWSLVGCRLWGRSELDTTEATQQQQQQRLYIFYSGLFPTLNQVCLVFDIELYELFIYFEYESPVDHIIY